MSKLLDDEYMQIINKKCMNTKNIILTCKKIQDKISDYDLIIPTKDSIELLYTYNYTKEQLKIITKHYKLKISGNKKEVINRIHCFLHLSIYVIKIQKIIRGILQRKINSCRGPAFIKRSLCTNDTDFFTMDELNTLSYLQFFSYCDVDGFIYGFDIISLYTLIKQSKKDFIEDVKNPYNRNIIPQIILNKITTLLRLSKILKIHIQIDIKETNNLTNQKSLELRILDLFQNIDSLGNYSTPAWFNLLSRPLLLKFMREIIDIWNYRAQISNETKRCICPPHGDPFRELNLNYIYGQNDVTIIKEQILTILEKIVNTGINHDSKTLGSYYVLGALTLVNENAATSLPWLYQSFCYL